MEKSALKANGDHSLIARCAKGAELDHKHAEFLARADRSNRVVMGYSHT